jgi:hypothetical protein
MDGCQGIIYHHREMSGVAIIAGMLPLEFTSSALIKHFVGPTTLTPGMDIEIRVEKRPTGLTIVELRLSAGARAARLSALEAQSKDAEDRHSLSIGLRRFH